MEPRQPEIYRQFRDAYRNGRFPTIVAEGDALAATLDRDPRLRAFVPATSLMIGAAYAELDAYSTACRYLEYGLERYRIDEGSHLRELGGADWFSLRLVEVEMLLGRYGDAWTLLTTLEAPDKPDLTRLAAIRGRSELNTIRGDYEGAHHLLNAASSVTDRIHSEFHVATLEADRSVVLAMQGRMLEGIALAHRTLERLSQPAAGAMGAWSSQSTAALALTLSRLCLDTGNVADGERFLLVGTAAVDRARSTYLRACVDLGICALWRAQGAEGVAEPLCTEAGLTFGRLACRPAEAQTTLELAKIAEARGMTTSAIPLFERARDEFRFLGHARELRDSEARLHRACEAP
ncbi:MAG: hypothetical protein HYX32_08330 [Actinobacteria bacterium]|nr:hypothetical protein [Actinomycetota bacterium]